MSQLPVIDMPVSDQGVNRERYMLVPRTLIFLTRGERVLLIKGAPHKRLWANKYNGIGGHIEPGEDALSAARRELNEETGLQAEELRLCGVVTIDTAQNPGVGIYIFHGECPTGEARPSSEGELTWVKRDEIPHLPVLEDLPVFLSRIMAIRKEDPPFSAHTSYTADGKMVIRFGE